MPTESDETTAGTSSILEEDTSRSLAATLALARAKGYVDKNKDRTPTVVFSKAKRAKLEAKAVVIEDKKDNEGRREFRGPRGSQLREVKEPEDIQLDVNLERTDDTGRKLTPKEAYKVMCYNFHGIGPGKNKIDKRLKKQALERRRN